MLVEMFRDSDLIYQVTLQAGGWIEPFIENRTS
jgi:hypothetical protein